MDRESFPLEFRHFDKQFVTIRVDISSANKFKFKNLFRAFKDSYQKTTGMTLSNKKVVIVIHEK